jgi:hypothetical protein
LQKQTNFCYISLMETPQSPDRKQRPDFGPKQVKRVEDLTPSDKYRYRSGDATLRNTAFFSPADEPDYIKAYDMVYIGQHPDGNLRFIVQQDENIFENRFHPTGVNLEPDKDGNWNSRNWLEYLQQEENSPQKK